MIHPLCYAHPAESLVQNQWVEMDAPIDPAQQQSDAGDVSAIKALLDLQAGSKVRVERGGDGQGSGLVELQQVGPQSDVITIGQFYP